MRTRSLMLGIAFVLLDTIPLQADPPVSDDADYLQFPMELRQWHQSPMRAVGGLIIHASTLPPTTQDPFPATRRLPPQPRRADELTRGR
jgi:hypothetical protein